MKLLAHMMSLGTVGTGVKPRREMRDQRRERVYDLALVLLNPLLGNAA